MDPQQRLLLECTAEVFVQPLTAGPIATVAAMAAGGRPAVTDWGVYIGASSTDYLRLAAAYSATATAFAATSGTLSVASGRLSFTFGLRGPAVTVDTACSSSLVACHAAMGGLRLRQCGGALVGGVNLTLTPDTPAMFQRAGECGFKCANVWVWGNLLMHHARSSGDMPVAGIDGLGCIRYSNGRP